MIAPSMANDYEAKGASLIMVDDGKVAVFTFTTRTGHPVLVQMQRRVLVRLAKQINLELFGDPQLSASQLEGE